MTNILFLLIGIVLGYILDKPRLKSLGISISTSVKKPHGYFMSPTKRRKLKRFKKELTGGDL